MIKSFIEVVSRDPSVISYVDEASPTLTYVGLVTSGATPASQQTGEPVWTIFALVKTGTVEAMQKPIDPDTGKYFTNPNTRIRNDRTNYIYG